MKKNSPSYELECLRRLADTGEVYPSKRVVSYLNNHGYDVAEVAMGVLVAICEGSCKFDETVELDVLPGVWADVYLVEWSNESWYVKLYIEEGIVILSCKPDGSIW
jgi:hypothetical protein